MPPMPLAEKLGLRPSVGERREVKAGSTVRSMGEVKLGGKVRTPAWMPAWEVRRVEREMSRTGAARGASIVSRSGGEG